MKKFLIIAASIFSILTTSGISVYADNSTSSKTEETQSTYTVIPILSKHQNSNVNGYFDMTWAPNEEGEIGITIVNNTNEDKIFTIEVNKALTNGNGALVYNDSSQNEIGDEPYLNKMFSFDKEVKVKAKSQKNVNSKYKFTKDNLSGTKMAGVYVSEKVSDNENQINMKYNYAYPIVVRGNSKDGPKVNIKFDKFVLKKDDTGTLLLKTPFENVNANYLKDSSIDVSLKDKSGKEVYGITKKELILTPESIIPYSTYITKELPSGEYKVDFTIKNGKDKWTETQSVTLKDDSKQESTIEIRDDESSNVSNSNLPIILLGAVLFVLVVGGFVYKQKKDNATKNK